MQKELTAEKFFDSNVPDMPSVEQIGKYLFCPEDHWKIKSYPSFYMKVSDRNRFWKRIVSNVEQHCELRVETRVVNIEKFEEIFRLCLLSNGQEEIVYCQKVVLAGGRFMPMQNLLKNVGTADSHVFRRYEFGFRMQVPTDNRAIKLLRSFGLKDPKLIMSPFANVEYRTFCFCVDGEVSKSCIDGVTTFSGRGDVEPTGFTNFAILVRTTSSQRFSDDEIKQFLATTFEFQNSLSLENDIMNYFEKSRSIAALILAAIRSLFAKFPDLDCKELRLFGPCLEGVGKYPNVDLHMAVKDAPNVYAIGDTHGGFRGLIPAFLCGFYLANCLKFADNGLLFISRNANKQSEISAIIGPLKRISIQSDTEDSVDAKVICLHKKYIASEQFLPGKKLLIETTCLFVNGKSGFERYFDLVGQERFILETENAPAKMICYLTLVDGDTGVLLQQTVGERNGTIVKPRGSNGFGWDSLFLPENSLKTFAEMEQGEKNFHTARSIAANKLFQF